MLPMNGNFNPFAILNKQEREHIMFTSCVTVRYVFLSPTSDEPTSVLFSYKRASCYITDNKYFSLF